jgi:glutaredoxin
MPTIKKLVVISLIFVVFNLNAGIYKWVDEGGNIYYSQHKPKDRSVEEMQIKSYKNVVLEEVKVDIQSKVNSTHKKPLITRPKKIIMYSAEWCGVCKKAKKYFKSQHIAYTNYDIDKSKIAKARYKKMGAKGVPVLFVGKRRMNGFSVAGFKSVYE